jgi:hypothetical protein
MKNHLNLGVRIPLQAQFCKFLLFDKPFLRGILPHGKIPIPVFNQNQRIKEMAIAPHRRICLSCVIKA